MKGYIVYRKYDDCSTIEESRVYYSYKKALEYFYSLIGSDLFSITEDLDFKKGSEFFRNTQGLSEFYKNDLFIDTDVEGSNSLSFNIEEETNFRTFLQWGTEDNYITLSIIDLMEE